MYIQRMEWDDGKRETGGYLVGMGKSLKKYFKSAQLRILECFVSFVPLDNPFERDGSEHEITWDEVYYHSERSPIARQQFPVPQLFLKIFHSSLLVPRDCATLYFILFYISV